MNPVILYYALLIWAIALILAAWWWLTREPDPEPPRPPDPPDPIVKLVDKWAHDWERGRA